MHVILFNQRPRFTVFILGQIVVYLFTCVIKLIAAYLMHNGVLIPLSIGLTLYLAGIFAVRLLLPPEASDHELLTRPSPETYTSLFASKFKSTVKSTVESITEIFRFLSLSWTIWAIIPTFLATTIFGHAMAGSVFLQYAGKQTRRTIADVSHHSLAHLRALANVHCI